MMPYSVLSMRSALTVQVAVLVGSEVDVAVIVAVPVPTAVTTPSSTVAALGLDDIQVTVCDAVIGRMLAVSCCV